MRHSCFRHCLFYFIFFSNPFLKKTVKKNAVFIGEKKYAQSNRPLRFFRFLAVRFGLTSCLVQHLKQTRDPSDSRFNRSNRTFRCLKHFFYNKYFFDQRMCDITNVFLFNKSILSNSILS
jgi:hypothetical protein